MLASILLLGAMWPGPSLAVVARHSLNHGRRQGVIAALAHGLGIGIYAALSLLGIAALLLHAPLLLPMLQLAGAVLLLYLAFQALRSALSPQQASVASQHTGDYHAGREGFLIAFLNPKVGLFFLALFSQFVDPHTQAAQKALIALLAFGIDSLWYLLVALLLGSPQAQQGFIRWRRGIEAGFALLLALLAVRVLWDLITSMA